MKSKNDIEKKSTSNSQSSKLQKPLKSESNIDKKASKQRKIKLMSILKSSSCLRLI